MKPITVVLATAAFAFPTSLSAQSDQRAAAILEAAKEATGGAAWDTLQGSYEQGEHSGRGYETWLDFRRYGMAMKTAGGQSQGFDGKTAWSRDAAGNVKTDVDAAAIKEAITTAFVSNNGYFFPERFTATPTYAGERTDGDASFDVIKVAPAGGRPFELWFRHDTHLLERVVDRDGPQPVSVILSDYRQVGKVRVAYRATVKSLDGAVLDEGRVNKVEHRPVAAKTFSPPSGE